MTRIVGNYKRDVGRMGGSSSIVTDVFDCCTWQGTGKAEVKGMVETSSSSALGCCAELRRCTEVNSICSNIVRFLDVADIGCEMGDIV